MVPVSAQGLLQSPSKEIRVADIRVEGNKTVDKSLILKALLVSRGQSYIPPVLKNKIQGSVMALNKLSLFSDIRVEQDQPDSVDGIILYFIVSELPTLGKVEYKGLDEFDKDDFKGKIDLVEGQLYSPGNIEAARQKILDMYRDKGYLLAEVKVQESDEKATGHKIVTFVVDEGKKVAVRYITFDGNAHVPDKELRKHFKTKEERWWRGGDYKEDDYRLGLDSLVQYYQTLGYLDAAVLSDSIRYSANKKYMDIRVKVQEGKRYHFMAAHFIHNNIVKDEALRAQILFDSGRSSTSPSTS